MQLNENIQICLLALASRYPESIIDINEAVLGPQPLGAEGWRVQDILELFQTTTPHVLHTKATLVLNEQESMLYLVDVDPQKHLPALRIHCHGKISPSQGDMRSRQLVHR